MERGNARGFRPKEKIRDSPESDRSVVFQSCMQDLRENLVVEIERWAPLYVDLAVAYPQLAKTIPTEWARDRMRKVIDKRLRTPDLNGAIAFCLITMSGGDVEAKNQRQAPQWMFSGIDSAYGIRAEHQTVLRRLEHALEQTLAREQLSMIVAAGDAHRAHIITVDE